MLHYLQSLPSSDHTYNGLKTSLVDEEDWTVTLSTLQGDYWNSDFHLSFLTVWNEAMNAIKSGKGMTLKIFVDWQFSNDIYDCYVYDQNGTDPH